ncbi:Metallo-dependent hydrolase [Gloeophyllum trabeum ATCC 11539]|uniref:Metallo-dependent hydrolase n=1 Tax=Gloeophyllum trabeum (strain ATCC 11539 / FP-39264 / Madison 617) TaxID=670483 RepID=S7RZ31_GLOTA|nr:Metallo-dependent hydrolase [Gloeophyllum trabeum ATCC 11539]EPQ60250.1 Metallo-dependent hydrolase [Gloeophyllum trabeum ATCC 11539]
MTDLASDTYSQLDVLPGPAVLAHVVDVHCHPTDTAIQPESMDKLPIKICAMATRQSDQAKVADLATAYPSKVIPCFGHHPWFTHWISLDPTASKEQHYQSLFANSSQKHAETLQAMLPTIPDPIPLSSLVSTLRANLRAFPHAMLGEVGLDRSARVPLDPNTTPRVLSPFTIPIDHQMAVLTAQLEVAVELRRNVSLHDVKAHQATADLLKSMSEKFKENWWEISVDLHSCGVSPEMWKDIERVHPNVFLSLSTCINSRSPNHVALIKACAANRLLAESDIHDVNYCAPYTWDMIRTIANFKGWRIEEQWDYDDGSKEEEWGVVKRLEENWKAFQAGNHPSPLKSKKPEWVTGGNRKSRMRSAKDRNEWVSDDSELDS